MNIWLHHICKCIKKNKNIVQKNKKTKKFFIEFYQLISPLSYLYTHVYFAENYPESFWLRDVYEKEMKYSTD